MKNSVTLCLENREQHFYGMIEQEAEEMTTGHDFVEDELTLLGTGLDNLQRLVETEDGVHGPHHTLGKTGDAETAEYLVVLAGRTISPSFTKSDLRFFANHLRSFQLR